MSSRGRGGYGGYSGGRGSYSSRGTGGYRGSYRGNSRGSYESRGGRGGGSGYYNENRYNNSGPRYGSSRDRMEDSYKKPYRVESTVNYSSRDYGGRSGSPERKRMRMEGSSDRRSNDGGGHYYGGRQDNYERRGFGGEERRRSMSRDTREGYRKTSDMPPPRSPARPRVSRPPRRSFRGRSLRTRASYRGTLRSRPSFAARRYSERPLAYTRNFRSIKGHSSIKSKEDEDDEEASSTEEDWDADDKDDEEDIVEEKEPKGKLSPKATPEGAETAAAAESGSDTEKEADAGSEEARPRRAPRAAAVTPSGRPYVHLICVHCKEKYATFASYTKHLGSGKHRASMNSVARRHKAQLLRMRVAQRGAQRELEAAAGAELAARTTFCLVCRLNHRTTRHAHNLTDTHRAMKRFLMPSCRACRLTFRSPMIYEHHICSLDHLKRKANSNVRRPSPKEADGSGDEGMDVDLENFMTLDSVGDVDEVDDEDSVGEKKEETEDKKPKVEINIGSEHIKKLEVYWCELCRTYLPRGPGSGSAEAAEEALRRHCRLRLHLGRYVQHRDTRTLRRQAERIHRQLHQAAKEEKSESEEASPNKIKTEKTEAKEDKKLENGNDASGDDKLWADVDKDIGELLREVGPAGGGGGGERSDDDEDLARYDKFRKSDKKPLDDAVESESQAAENTEEKASTEINVAA